LNLGLCRFIAQSGFHFLILPWTLETFGHGKVGYNVKETNQLYRVSILNKHDLFAFRSMFWLLGDQVHGRHRQQLSSSAICSWFYVLPLSTTFSTSMWYALSVSMSQPHMCK